MTSLSPAGCKTKGRNDNWATPMHVFNELDDEFHFTLDVCANEYNTKCQKFFTKEQNGLKQSWAGEVCFCNPPYSDIGPWVRKAFEESNDNCGATVVLLIPPRVDQWYWHEYIVPYKAEVRFWRGRIQFIPPEGIKASSNSTGSCIVIFRPPTQFNYGNSF